MVLARSYLLILKMIQLILNMLSSKLFESDRKLCLSDYTFVLDNDSKHNSNLLSEFFETHDIKVLLWGFLKSPDCNSIDNLAGIIKYKNGNTPFKTKFDF
ncbi:hypothetical protein DMUE_1423 [Dictyocoela muelleri]|nr:hypothetical protein DMUE_1423 [Dictyocoela muelleri]